MTTFEKVCKLRDAGAVKRYHTERHLVQDIAQHSFGMLTLAYTVLDYPTPELIRAIVFHDIPERWTGDWPFPVKKRDEEIRQMYAQYEKNVVSHLDIPHNQNLSVKDAKILKYLDMTELLLFCLEQRKIGNIYAEPVFLTAVGSFDLDNVMSISLRLVDVIQEAIYEFGSITGKSPVDVTMKAAERFRHVCQEVLHS